MKQIDIETFNDLYDATYYLETMIENENASKVEILRTPNNRFRVTVEWEVDGS